MREAKRCGGLQKSYILPVLVLFLTTYVSCNCNNDLSNYNEKNGTQENKGANDNQESVQINSDLALTPLLLPEGSGIILCNGPFALCSAAFCERDPENSSKTKCTCPVMTGPAIGDSDVMEKFRPDGETGCASPSAPYRIWSFFQPLKEIPQAPDFKSKQAFGMACPEGKYANCFGFPCEWDGKSGTATCHCEAATGAFETQAGDCDKNNCQRSPFDMPSGSPLDNPPYTGVTQSCPLQK